MSFFIGLAIVFLAMCIEDAGTKIAHAIERVGNAVPRAGSKR